VSAGAPREWDAATYDRVSDPQVEMALPVLERLPLEGDERVLDAGCGTGRVTQLLVERVPRGRVIGVDASEAMCAKARDALGERATVLCQDLLELDLGAGPPTASHEAAGPPAGDPVDAIFSTATFHWIVDHDRLFARLAAALRPGGRLVAQCGGAGNIASVEAAATEVGERPAYAEWLAGWTWPKRMAGPEETEARLRAAGFSDARAWLEPWPVTPADPPAFLEKVCLRAHADRLPPERRAPFVAEVLELLGDPVVLDYVRLNLEARRAV
jgi:trans-aconitate 2-methyltransferase